MGGRAMQRQKQTGLSKEQEDWARRQHVTIMLVIAVMAAASVMVIVVLLQRAKCVWSGRRRCCRQCQWIFDHSIVNKKVRR
jgi:hypothetical protein